MKNRKISMLLVFVLSITLLAGCGGSKLDETAKKPVGDVLKEAMEKQQAVESAHSLVEINAKVDLPEEMTSMPEMSMLAPYLKGTKITIDQNSMLKENLISSKIKLEATEDEGAPAYDMNIYILSATRMAIQTSLYPKILVMDTEEMKELAEAQGQAMPVDVSMDFNSEETKKMTKLTQDILAEAFKGIEPTKRENKEMEIAGGKQELHVIEYTYKSNDEIIDLAGKIVKNMLESDKLYDILSSEEFDAIISATAKQMDPMSTEKVSFKDQYPTKEDFAEIQKQALEQYEAMIPMAKEELANVIDIKELSIKMGVNADGYMTYSDMVFDGTVKNAEAEMEIPAKIAMSSYVDKINEIKKEDIETVELTDENSISFTEFVGQMFGM